MMSDVAVAATRYYVFCCYLKYFTVLIKIHFFILLVLPHVLYFVDTARDRALHCFALSWSMLAQSKSLIVIGLHKVKCFFGANRMNDA